MYIQVTRSIFHDEFRSIRPDNFNYAGLNALLDYMEECESGERGQYGDAGNELDVIAICCDFCQYDSIEEACYACGVADREELEGESVVLDCGDGSVIVNNF